MKSAHAAFPWIVTWDDHEVENNYANVIPEKGQSVEAFIQRRAAAYQAYYEHMPLRQTSLPHGTDMRLYRDFSYGKLASFQVLDTRQYRDDQANGDGTKPQTPESLDPKRTLLGIEQEKWLLLILKNQRVIGTYWLNKFSLLPENLERRLSLHTAWMHGMGIRRIVSVLLILLKRKSWTTSLY